MRSVVALLICGLLALATGAPLLEKENYTTTYDQKQTGEYNIQLHLKDFQIIAVIADEQLDGFGDYDYTYDYADLTVKPTGITTPKPTSISTSKPTTTEDKESQPSTTIMPSKVETTSTSTTVAPTTTSTTTTTTITTTTESPPKSTQRYLADFLKNKTDTPVTNISIVPHEDMGVEVGEHNQLGEIVQYRRCASGYSRDKRGRCRRVRRPSGPLPFGITRLASSIAAKFRQATAGEGFLGTND